MSGGLRALARLRLAVHCSSDGEVAFHTQRKDTSEDGGSPRCPPRAGRANGSAGVRWAASDRRNYFFLHPGTADRELAEPRYGVWRLSSTGVVRRALLLRRRRLLIGPCDSPGWAMHTPHWTSDRPTASRCSAVGFVTPPHRAAAGALRRPRMAVADRDELWEGGCQ